jgi:hypothetical protein
MGITPSSVGDGRLEGKMFFIEKRGALVLLTLAAGGMLRMMRPWRGKTAKEELYRKILGDGAVAAVAQAGGVCALYDAAAAKFAEGMSVESIARIMAKGMAGTLENDPEWTIDWMLGPSLKDRSDPMGHRMGL